MFVCRWRPTQHTFNKGTSLEKLNIIVITYIRYFVINLEMRRKQKYILTTGFIFEENPLFPQRQTCPERSVIQIVLVDISKIFCKYDEQFSLLFKTPKISRRIFHP